MKVLVTGFKVFLGESLNPSELLAIEISKKNPRVSHLVLPVEFGNSFNILKSHINNNQYDFVIMLGQAAGRSKVCLEKVALNWVQTENKDEAGWQPKTGKILESEALAFMTKFPVDFVYEQLKKQNFPVEISFSAGAYVCNELYFRVCSEFQDLKSVFIHVPLIPEQCFKENPRPFLEYEIQLKVISDVIALLNVKN